MLTADLNIQLIWRQKDQNGLALYKDRIRGFEYEYNIQVFWNNKPCKMVEDSDVLKNYFAFIFTVNQSEKYSHTTTYEYIIHM